MMERGTPRAKWLVVLMAIAVFAAACTTGGAATTAPSAAAPSTEASAAAPSEAAPSAAGSYTIGFSNTGGTGNGFREEQNCTAKAEALSSGQVAKVDMIARDADAAQQLADLRTL